MSIKDDISIINNFVKSIDKDKHSAKEVLSAISRCLEELNNKIMLLEREIGPGDAFVDNSGIPNKLN